MEPFRTLTSLAVPLDRTNVDTDQIIPKQFLKRIERTGYGDFLFFDWRRTASGDPDPSFELNNPRYKGSQILIAGKNGIVLVRLSEEQVAELLNNAKTIPNYQLTVSLQAQTVTDGRGFSATF